MEDQREYETVEAKQEMSDTYNTVQPHNNELFDGRRAGI